MEAGVRYVYDSTLTTHTLCKTISVNYLWRVLLRMRHDLKRMGADVTTYFS